MRLRPCFRAVDSTLCYVAKSVGPCAGRNPPEIFVRDPIVHGSCSARMAVKRNPVIQKRCGQCYLRPFRNGHTGCSGSSPSWQPWSVRNRNATRCTAVSSLGAIVVHLAMSLSTTLRPAHDTTTGLAVRDAVPRLETGSDRRPPRILDPMNGSERHAPRKP